MILVTGGTGLVGSHLLLNLIQKGYAIRATKRPNSNLSKTKSVFTSQHENGARLFEKIEWVDACITDIPQLCLAFENIEQVFHCAALISFNPKDAKTLRETNIQGTANIVNLCIDFNINKLVHVSSIATFGNSKSQISEKTFWNPERKNSRYAITKYGAELEVWRGTQEGLNAVIVNPGVILGDVFFDSGSGLLFKKIKKGFNYFTKGATGFTDVIDLVNVMVYLMESDIKNEQYLVVSENATFEQFFKTTIKHLGSKKKLNPLNQTTLQIALALDQLKSFLFRTTPSLTKESIRAAQNHEVFDNEKITCVIPFKLTPLETTIKRICASNFLQ